MNSYDNSLDEFCIITDIHDRILSSSISFQKKFRDHFKKNPAPLFNEIISGDEKEKYLHLKKFFLHYPETSKIFDLHFEGKEKHVSHFLWKMTALMDEKGMIKNICLTGSNISHNVLKEPLFIEENNSVSLLESSSLCASFIQNNFQDDVRFKDIAQNVPCVIYQWYENNDGSNGFNYISPKLKEYFNINPANIASFENMIHPDDKKIWSRSVRKKNINQQFYEGRFLYPDGSIKWWQGISALPVKTKNGHVYNGILTNITEMVTARQELVKSNERYNYAAKATSDGIWDWDCIEKKIYRSDTFLSIFGYKESIIEFENVSGRIHPDDRQSVECSLANAINKNAERWEAEYRLRCENGTYKIVLNKASLIHDENKKLIRVIGAVRDLSEQRMLEKKLADEANQKKQEIIQAIIEAQEKERKELAYELHDNINQVLATCTLLLDLAKKNPALSAPYLEKCSANILKIINEIRDISRTLTTFTLDNLGLVAALKDISEKINETGKIYIIFKTSKTHNDHVIPAGIKLTVFRIIQENINNVIKHSKASELKIILSFNTKKLKLEIADNGTGFDLEKIKKGLGLQNIVNRVEYYHGKIAINTAPGKGCIISIEFSY